MTRNNKNKSEASNSKSKASASPAPNGPTTDTIQEPKYTYITVPKPDMIGPECESLANSVQNLSDSQAVKLNPNEDLFNSDDELSPAAKARKYATKHWPCDRQASIDVDRTSPFIEHIEEVHSTKKDTTSGTKDRNDTFNVESGRSSTPEPTAKRARVMNNATVRKDSRDKKSK